MLPLVAIDWGALAGVERASDEVLRAETTRASCDLLRPLQGPAAAASRQSAGAVQPAERCRRRWVTSHRTRPSSLPAPSPQHPERNDGAVAYQPAAHGVLPGGAWECSVFSRFFICPKACAKNLAACRVYTRELRGIPSSKGCSFLLLYVFKKPFQRSLPACLPACQGAPLRPHPHRRCHAGT